MLIVFGGLILWVVQASPQFQQVQIHLGRMLVSCALIMNHFIHFALPPLTK